MNFGVMKLKIKFAPGQVLSKEQLKQIVKDKLREMRHQHRDRADAMVRHDVDRELEALGGAVIGRDVGARRLRGVDEREEDRGVMDRWDDGRVRPHEWDEMDMWADAHRDARPARGQNIRLAPGQKSSLTPEQEKAFRELRANLLAKNGSIKSSDLFRGIKKWNPLHVIATFNKETKEETVETYAKFIKDNFTTAEISKMYCEFDSVLRTPLDVATEYYGNACLFKQVYERATARNPANASASGINGAGVQSVANGSEQKDTAPQKVSVPAVPVEATKPQQQGPEQKPDLIRAAQSPQLIVSNLSQPGLPSATPFWSPPNEYRSIIIQPDVLPNIAERSGQESVGQHNIEFNSQPGLPANRR